METPHHELRFHHFLCTGQNDHPVDCLDNWVKPTLQACRQFTVGGACDRSHHHSTAKTMAKEVNRTSWSQPDDLLENRDQMPSSILCPLVGDGVMIESMLQQGTQGTGIRVPTEGDCEPVGATVVLHYPNTARPPSRVVTHLNIPVVLLEMIDSAVRVIRLWMVRRAKASSGRVILEAVYQYDERFSGRDVGRVRIRSLK